MKSSKATPEFRVIVCGGRKWPDREPIKQALVDVGATLVAHGDCQGADWIADAVAQTLNLDIVKFPANWNKDGKAAGPIRNRRMFDIIRPELVLAFPTKESVGTWDMVKYAESRGCPAIVEEKYLGKKRPR